MEIDVARTSDGELVVLHRRELTEMLERADVGAGLGSNPSVEDFTYAELEELDAGGGERVPRAREVLAAVRRSVDVAILDVKHDGRDPGWTQEDMARATAQMAAEAGCGRKCVLWAKADSMVAAAHEVPGTRTGYVVMNETRAHSEAGMGEVDVEP